MGVPMLLSKLYVATLKIRLKKNAHTMSLELTFGLHLGALWVIFGLILATFSHFEENNMPKKKEAGPQRD